MSRWNHPCDPECPAYREFVDALFGDPITYAAPTDEIMEEFERRHRITCERCQDFGNVEIID